VLVAAESRLRDAARITPALSERGHRLDVAVLTDLDVSSDNRVGGLWERAVNLRRSLIESQLGLSGRGLGLRLLPRDPGVLARVAEVGVAAVDHESDEPFAQSLRRLARRVGRAEVGIALGAGMAKGFAHIGVLNLLRLHSVPIDYIAGSSIGSIVVSSNRGLKKILTTCHERAPTAEFPELFVPFAAAATDVTTGQEVVLRDGIVWSTVLASISMPGVFPPVVHEGRVLVDGGREMGADIVIGVDLATTAQPEAPAEASPRLPNIIEMIWRTMEIMLGEITSRSAASADVTIRPSTGHSHIRDFSRRGPEFVAAGERAALAALPEIATYLPSIEVPQ
jgi:NTE family protein